MNHIAREISPEISTAAALTRFLAETRPGGRLLLAGLGRGTPSEVAALRGFVTEAFDLDPDRAREVAPLVERAWAADVRLLSVGKESYDGIWAPRLFRALDPPACQRALGAFFAAAKPGAALFVAIDASNADDEAADGSSSQADAKNPGHYRYPREEFASLLRQSGFRVLVEGSPESAPERVGFLARRI